MPQNITNRQDSNEKPSFGVANKIANFFLSLIIAAPQLVGRGALMGASGYITQEVLKEVELTGKTIELIQPKAQQTITEIESKFVQVVEYLSSLDDAVPLSVSLKMLGMALGTSGAIHALRLVKENFISIIQQAKYSEQTFWKPTFELFYIFNQDSNEGDSQFEVESDVSDKSEFADFREGQKVYNFNEKINQFIENLKGNPTFNNTENYYYSNDGGK